VSEHTYTHRAIALDDILKKELSVAKTVI
jgi:hypothetical protein